MAWLAFRSAVRLAMAGLWLVLANAPVLAQPAALLGDVEWVIRALAKDSGDALVIEATDLIEEPLDGVPGVTLRNASIAMKDWGRAELGNMRAVERKAASGLKRLTFVFPTTFELYNRDGQFMPPPVNLAEASLVIDFTSPRRAFRRLELSARTIEIQDSQSRVAVDGFSLVSESAPGAGPAACTVAFDADGILVRGPGLDHLKLGKLVVNHDFEGMNVPAIEGFTAALRDFRQQRDLQGQPEALLRFTAAALKRHGVLASAFKQSIRVGGLDYLNSADKQSFRLAGFILEQDMRGFDKGSVDWRFFAEYAGLEMPQTAIDPRLFTTGMAADLTIKGIPTGALLETLTRSFDRFAMGQTDPGLHAALAQIGTTAGIAVQINRLAFSTPTLAGHATGQFAFDADAASFGSGEALALFYGLDALVQGIRTGQNSFDENTRRGILFLGTLATPSRAPDGKPAQAMRLQFGRDGKLMVNGRDLTPPPPQQRVP